jgi:hypothetical protein
VFVVVVNVDVCAITKKAVVSGLRIIINKHKMVRTEMKRNKVGDNSDLITL